MVRFYVGNVKYEATEDDLRQLFAPHAVGSVKIMIDRDSGQPRGFCFVEIDGVTARQIVDEFDGREFMGRNLKVDEARPQERREHGGAGSARGTRRAERRSDRRRDDYGEGWER